jgi:hypothetical protein
MMEDLNGRRSCILSQFDVMSHISASVDRRILSTGTLKSRHDYDCDCDTSKADRPPFPGWTAGGTESRLACIGLGVACAPPSRKSPKNRKQSETFMWRAES